MGAANASSRGDWTFLTSHALVLIEVARDPDARIRDVAERLDLTERRVQSVLGDLVEAGYLSRTQIGRRYRYRITARTRLRHARVRRVEVRALLELVERADARKPTRD